MVKNNKDQELEVVVEVKEDGTQIATFKKSTSSPIKSHE